MERFRVFIYLRRSGASMWEALDHSDLLELVIALILAICVSVGGTYFLYTHPRLLGWIWGG